jgi:CheY-like chemotaxis protein
MDWSEESRMKALKVLLVEDSPRIAGMLRDLLEVESGISDIHIVPDQQDAITQVRQTTYDLMILDLQLRSGTGFGVLEALGDEHPLTVVLTNHALPEYRRRAGELGAEYFLDKSKDLEQLQSIIQRLQMD